MLDHHRRELLAVQANQNEGKESEGVMESARTTIINISLPERLLHLADQRAQAESRTRSDFFREAVRRYLGLTTVVSAARSSVPPADLAPSGAGSVGFDFDHNPTWRIFRIMAEFIDGFEFLAQFDKSVTFFGSARMGEDDPHYGLAVELAGLVAQEGYAVISGGGPGVMEAVNKGAHQAGGESVGLNIQLPTEQRINQYVSKSIGFNYFFARKVMMNISAWAYVFFPGGFGTLDEFFELITLAQTDKIERHVPIILVGKDFWLPLCGWLRQYVLSRGAIVPEDLELWNVVDSADEAMALIRGSKPRVRRIYQ